ncbi:ATP-binding protein [Thermodesulfobacteriota bacterium B35]
MRNRPLFWQIFLAGLSVLILAIIAVSWYGTFMVRQFYYGQMRDDIHSRAILVRPQISSLLRARPASLQEFCRQTGRAARTRITVIAPDGTVLADSNEDPRHMDNHGHRPEVLTAMGGKVGSSFRESKTLSRKMLYVAIPLDSDHPAAGGILRLSVPATSMDRVLATIHRRIFLGTLFIILLAALSAYFIARRISRPLEEMRAAAEQLASGRSDQPVPVRDTHVSREVADLARSLNNMADQVSRRIKIIIQQKNELEAVFSSMAEGILAVDLGHRVIRINRAASEIFQVDPQAAKERPMEGVLRNRGLQEFIIRSLRETDAIRKEIVLDAADGETLLSLHAVPLFDGEGKRMGSLVAMKNITRIHQLENIRRDFVANVSHELKTPITAIRGCVETLLDSAGDDPDASRRFMEIISRQAGRLDAIVDDLLTLSRIEDRTAKSAIRTAPENILTLLEACRQTCLLAAEQKDITIDIACDPDLQGDCNRAMMEQAVINLLTNGVTYSPEHSRIFLQAEQVRDDDGRQQVRISVTDQGPGIGREHQERIFERFYRCDRARSREAGGTGLGLAIVKHIAQAHNGTVALHSEPGRGSTFFITFPASS